MKFNVGDKIKIVKPFLRMGRNHLGSVGIVTEHRCYGGRYSRNEPTSDNFAVNAFTFVKDVLNYGSMNIVESIYYVIAWADQLGIDLVWHIEHKMKYNELRSYKHGGKKY